MTYYYHAYIAVSHKKGRGWKWAFFYGPTRNPKDALLVRTGIVEKSSIYTTELIAYQELLKSTRCDMSLKVYASQYLRDLFAEKGDKGWFSYWGSLGQSNGNLELAKEIRKYLEYCWEVRQMRFYVAEERFEGKRFVDVLCNE